ncbi:type 4a pilus biogenesis protein PilO [Pseudomonadales bacterium]|jgi:type IV pilus assembly protein PilO|nr:type 4a pilus biogenesis protein PilO [Pseudomonadales bacterium]MDB4493182.1 type 4a pilus biogenesis protein PilO [Pseudomonadales bacterium]
MAIAEKLQGWRDAASEIELDQIDWEEPGTWPALVKSGLMILAVLLTALLGYIFVVKAQLDGLNSAEGEELALRAEFQAKAFEAANLAALRDQMAEMNQMFGALVSQLPSDTEVPGLLEDITAIGSSNGLEFNSIELQEEILQEFYIELPIDILVTGTYHDLGSFVSGISGLPRIVTLHDFEMLPVESRPGVMQMSIMAKTYRYKEEG